MITSCFTVCLLPAKFGSPLVVPCWSYRINNLNLFLNLSFEMGSCNQKLKWLGSHCSHAKSITFKVWWKLVLGKKRYKVFDLAVNSHNHLGNGSYDLKSESLSYLLTTLPSFLVVGLADDEIEWLKFITWFQVTRH